MAAGDPKIKKFFFNLGVKKGLDFKLKWVVFVCKPCVAPKVTICTN